MTVEITTDAIGKLTHNSDEIRLRALEQIESKIIRSLCHQLPLVFEPAELCKQLIHWFRYQSPPKTNVRVLQLLKRLLESSYGKIVIESFGIVRLKAELKKVQDLMRERRMEQQIINNINEILFEFEKGVSQSSSNDIVSLVETNVSNDDNSTTDLYNCKPEDYEFAWSKPAVADYNSLKVMADVLTDDESKIEEKNNVLQYLQVNMLDYPAEYMLQSPHLFSKILRLCQTYHDHENQIQTNIFATLLSFTRILKQRLCKRYKVDSFAVKKISLSSKARSQLGILAKSQLKVGKAIELLLEVCLQQLEAQVISVRREIVLIMETLKEILEIIKIEQISISRTFLAITDRIRNQLKDIYNNDENHITIARTRYIWLTFMLFKMIKINAKRSQLVDQYKLLAPQLLDVPLQRNFPKLFGQITKLIFAADNNIKESYEQVKCLNAQFEAGMQLLRHEDVEPSTVIAKSSNILPVLNIFKSLKLTKIIFNAILGAIPLYPTELQLKKDATHLLLKLMQLHTVNIKLHVYQSIAMAVKKHFASLMNSENICKGVHNYQLLSVQVIGVPCNITILQQIIYDSFESDCTELTKNAEEIILLLLRSHHFYETIWDSFIEIFSPNLPLLNCCTHLKQPINLLLKLLNPDSKLFSLTDLLRGNIGFMFIDDNTIRNEALTRLIYMLNLLPKSSDYVPNMNEISDILSNDLCILHNPRDFRQIFSANESYYDQTALRTLLTLLDTPDLEPKVRYSTLLQLNIMCKNWEMTAAFCDEQAYCLILSVLENSLKKDSSTDYVQSVIPTISILTKLLIYDSSFRCELTGISNVYILLLRALFHFSQDVQLCQDVSTCLFLLVFGSFLVMPRGSGDIEAPKLISNLRAPLKFKLVPISTSMDNSHPGSFFVNETEWKSYVRQVIAYSYLNNPSFSKKEIEQLHTSLDICPSLLIEQHDVRSIKASNYCHNMRTMIKDMSNATDQETFIKSGNTIRTQLMLHCLENAAQTQLPTDIANGLFLVLSKYLQITPGNEADFLVFECVLDLLTLCVRQSLVPIVSQIKSMLRTDFYHGVILMLKNPELPLDIYLHVSEFIRGLLNFYIDEGHNADQSFRCNLFELSHSLAQQFYTSRNLQRMRCLLGLLQALTASQLELPEHILYKCSKSFLKLSINMRSSTQTGAQFHKDCLLIFIQIFAQLPDVLKVRISEKILKHMIGLCGHIDMEVRALAWISLSIFAHIKTTCNNGSEIMTTHLKDLPGGFIGCCLCTFLDSYEMALVRHYAGNLFILLLKETCTFEKALLLLERHTFFATAYASLETCVFDNILPLHSPLLKTPLEHTEDICADIQLTTCETVNCYCRICITLIKLNPSYVTELCEKLLLFKLYELLKLPFVSTNAAHYEMCAQICYLYAMCSKNNFVFVQRTLCHDERWLSCLFDLLVPPNANEESIICVLQLTLVLCQEEFVFHRLCTRLANSIDILQNLCTRALTIAQISSPLQRITLTVLIYLLVKSQSQNILEVKKIYFTSALEKELVISQCNSDATNDENHFLPQTNNGNIIFESDNFKSVWQGCNNTSKKFTMSEIIVQQLYKIFVHLYPCNSCKFDSLPGTNRIQVCETLSLLLKLSSKARLAANNLRILNKILLILATFLREFGNSGTIFIKRHGEAKKLAVIKNLKLLYQILLYWFSPTAGVLVDELQCLEVSKIIIQSWTWFEQSLELKSLVLQVCSFLSERSIAFCRHFSAYNSSSHSILQKVVKVVIVETRKVRTLNETHNSVVAAGLRIMMNCCACTEGRIILLKEHVLDVIENLYPFNIKSPKTRLELFHNWLQFWELFSRYNEGGMTRNLSALYDVINRSRPCSRTRLICLKILRNMCFVQHNRSILMASSDFICIANQIITQPLSIDVKDLISYEEQLIVSVVIWQIISGGIKYISMLRGTKIASKLRILREQLLTIHEDHPTKFTKLPFAVDLANVLEIIFNILTEK